MSERLENFGENLDRLLDRVLQDVDPIEVELVLQERAQDLREVGAAAADAFDEDLEIPDGADPEARAEVSLRATFESIQMICGEDPAQEALTAVAKEELDS